jgi:hypothetical protein
MPDPSPECRRIAVRRQSGEISRSYVVINGHERVEAATGPAASSGKRSCRALRSQTTSSCRAPATTSPLSVWRIHDCWRCRLLVDGNGQRVPPCTTSSTTSRALSRAASPYSVVLRLRGPDERSLVCAWQPCLLEPRLPRLNNARPHVRPASAPRRWSCERGAASAIGVVPRASRRPARRSPSSIAPRATVRFRPTVSRSPSRDDRRSSGARRYPCFALRERVPIVVGWHSGTLAAQRRQRELRH